MRRYLGIVPDDWNVQAYQAAKEEEKANNTK